MKDRIRQIMEDQHLTQQSFAQMTQISTPTLSNILTGKSRATLNTVELIKRKFPLISLDWLLYGVGPMYIHDGAAPTPSDVTSDSSSSARHEPTDMALDFSDDDPAEVSPSSQSASAASLSAHSSSQPSSAYPSGSLFDQPVNHSVNTTRKNIAQTEVKYIDKPQRKITEIRIFYDDQTWETFVPKK